MNRLAFVLAAVMISSLGHAEPTDALGWLNQGNLLYSQKDYDMALGSYAKSLKLNNRSGTAYQGVGNVYLAKGDKARALKYYQYALKVEPHNDSLRAYVDKLQAATPAAPSADYRQGNQFYNERRYDDAIVAYNKAAVFNPRDAKAFQGLGNCYYAKNDKTNAAINYRKSLDIDPANTALSNFLAHYAPAQSDSVAVAQAQSDSGGGGWFQPAWRSLIVPGWGQGYNGQTTKGLVLGALTYGLLAAEIGTYVAGSSARNEYLSSNSPSANYDGMYSNWENMANMNHIFSIGMSVAYTFTLADAIFGAKSSSARAMTPSPVQLSFDSKGAQIRAKLLEF